MAPLPLPRLDTRTFDQLVAEGQVLLPRYAPAWTDYNAHDPGITLLELFAWLTETGFYRLDRVAEASHRAFLRLVGVEPRAAQVAETVILASSVTPGTESAVAQGARVESTDGVVAFQATRDTAVSAARLVAVVTGRAGQFVDRSKENLAATSSWPALDLTHQPGDALYLGYDAPLPALQAPFSLYVSTGFEEQDRETRARLDAEWESILADADKDSSLGVTAVPVDPRPHYAARVRWEYYTTSGAWAPLADVDDETRALTLSGFVRFRVPAAPQHAAGAMSLPGQMGRFFLRCRLESGCYDSPPRIRTVLHNALRARHAVTIAAHKLPETSNGRAAQSFAFGAAPLVPRTVEIKINVNGVADKPWREAQHWDQIRPHERAYVIAYDRGKVTFGDGRIGRVPAAGAELWVSYEVGGGAAGNVAAKTLTALRATLAVPVTAEQPLPALGGATAETLQDAIGRALAEQTAATRAVTLADFEELVLGMPGVPIARTLALADYHPDMPCLPARGSVTVVVVPQSAATPPVPSAELLCAVARYLERRRTLTTQLRVVGACYTTVSVQAQLHTTADADGSRLAGDARSALERFLDPLRGGADGSGWPIGRDVYRAEILALLQDLPGVVYVDQVTLQVGDGVSARCGNSAVCQHGLVASGTHQITIAATTGARKHS